MRVLKKTQKKSSGLPPQKPCPVGLAETELGRERKETDLPGSQKTLVGEKKPQTAPQNARRIRGKAGKLGGGRKLGTGGLFKGKDETTSFHQTWVRRVKISKTTKLADSKGERKCGG